MSQCIPSRVRRPLVLVGLAGAVLSGVSCRTDEVVAPTTGDSEASHASAATAALAFYQVSGGGFHTCGVTLDHRLYCWGAGFGYLGNGTTNGSTAPVAVAPSLRFQQVSAALSHSCAVTTDYRAYCWGSNADASLGDGTETDRLTPVPVAGGLRFRQVDAGDFHSCGVTYLENRAYCWGYGGTASSATARAPAVWYPLPSPGACGSAR